MKTPEEEGLLAPVITEPEIDELAQPSELQGGDISEEYQLAHIDVFLNRIFQEGALIPYKKCWFQVVGIRGGIVGLALKSVPQPPRARGNHGVRTPQRKHRTEEEKEQCRQLRLQQREAKKIRDEEKKQRRRAKRLKRNQPLSYKPEKKLIPRPALRKHPAIEGPIETFEGTE